MIENKPCPFCGGTDIDPSFSRCYAKGDKTQPIVAAGCSDCGAVGPDVRVPDHSTGYAKAMAKWNARGIPQPVVPALPTMQKAFVTAESGYGKYCLVFKFRTLGDLQAAHKEWVTQPAAQPAADQRCMNPRLWTKEMSDAWHSNIPDLQKAFDALLSAGKETTE